MVAGGKELMDGFVDGGWRQELMVEILDEWMDLDMDWMN